MCLLFPELQLATLTDGFVSVTAFFVTRVSITAKWLTSEARLTNMQLHVGLLQAE
jgi:hypothetical protein